MKIIKETLIDIFDRINIQTPSNFNEIAKFCKSKVGNNVDETSILFAFKQWIEQK